MTPEEHARHEQFRYGPGWRMALARYQRSQKGHDQSAYADPHVLEARQYLQARAAHPGQAVADAFPHLGAAERLQQDPALGASAKILALGHCPPTDIAECLGLDVVTINTWEQLFFDVRAQSAAWGWVHRWVIAPEEQGGNHALAAQMKYASASGPAGAKIVLDLRANITLAPGVKVFDDHLALQLKIDQALAVSLDKQRGTLRFLKMAFALRHQEARLKLAERQLEIHAEEVRCQLLVAKGRRAQAERRAKQDTRRETERRHKQLDKELRARQRRDLALALELAREQRRQAAIVRGEQSGLAQLCWERTQSTPPDAASNPPAAAPTIPGTDHPVAGSKTRTGHRGLN